MAYISSYELDGVNGASTSKSLTVPTHATDDVLLLFVTQDANTAITGPSGWTAIGAQTNGGTGVTSAAWYKKAASGAETCTITTTDGWCSILLNLKDVDTTTQLDASSFTGQATAASQFSNSAVTTTTADCLVLYFVGLDAVATAAHTNPGVMSLISFDNAGTTATTSACAAAGWYYQRATGSTQVADWTASASIAYTQLTAAFRNKAGGRIPAYIDDVSSPGSVITPGHHFSTLNGISFPAALSLANIGPGGTGKATVFDAAAATADYGINPYSSALSSTPAAQDATVAAGFQIDFSTAKDFSTGFVMGALIASNPKMANYIHGSVAQGGTYVAFADAANNYRSYQVLARNSNPNTEGRAVFSVQPSQTTTAYGTSGAMNAAAVTKMLLLSNCPTATITEYVSELHLVKTQVVAGGDATTPIDAEALAAVGRSFRLPVIQKTGAAGLLAYAPIQIGGGDAVNLKLTAGSLQFPRIFDAAKKEINFHAGSGAVGISLAGKSGDSIYIGDGYVLASPSAAYFEIHASATNAATWYLDGLTISGMPVTLRPVMTFTGMLFSDNPTLNFTGCTLDGCTISKVPAGNDTLTASATSNIDNCTINVSGVTAGNRWCSVTDPSIFTGNAFTGGGGHAIRITTAGTYSFVGNTFTGFGAAGSTGAAIYNDSGGAVTLNISGGGSTPTVRNGTGASTTVNNTVTVKITSKDVNTSANVQGARVLLYAAAGGTLPASASVTITRTGATATVSHTAHGLANGKKVMLVGADQGEYNGVKTISNAQTNSYDFTVSGTPATPATGTITSSAVILDADTDVNGVVQDTGFNYAGSQPVLGRIRKGTAVTYYKTSPISGTIGTNGLDVTIFLIPD